MKVNLPRNWFGPDASLHLASANPHDFDEAWETVLPTGSEVLPEPPPAPKPAAKVVAAKAE